MQGATSQAGPGCGAARARLVGGAGAARRLLMVLLLVWTGAACSAGPTDAPTDARRDPAPSVVSVGMAGREAPAGASVEVTFDGRLRPDAVAVPGLKVVDRRSEVVPGTWALDDARRRLFFLAARPLLYRSRYGVVIPAALLDGRGAGKGSGTARDETLTLFTGDPPDANVTPRLENLAVRLAPYDPVTRRMGDLLLDQLDRKPFLEFGAVVRGFQGENKVLPEFTFTRVDPSAVLVSPIDGVVTSIDDQGDGDVELWLRPSRNSDWLVYLDHVKDVMVRVGDPVTAGQPLCKTAGAFELNVMYDRTGAEKVVAPFVHFDPALSDAYQGLIWAVMEKAEELSGQSDWYDEAAMRALCAGCRALELKPY